MQVTFFFRYHYLVFQVINYGTQRIDLQREETRFYPLSLISYIAITKGWLGSVWESGLGFVTFPTGRVFSPFIPVALSPMSFRQASNLAERLQTTSGCSSNKLIVSLISFSRSYNSFINLPSFLKCNFQFLYLIASNSSSL